MITVFKVSAQLTNSDKVILGKLLTEKINKLRIEKNVAPLLRNVDLEKAAILHADYMSENKKLTHVEYDKKFRNPSDRILYFNKSFVAFGENVLYTKPIKYRINKTMLKMLAKEMFLSWKNSKGHYENMISPLFTEGDFGFTYNKQNKRIYATNAFGNKGNLISNQLSKNTFGIKRADNSCAGLIGNASNVVTNMGNAVYIDVEGNVILRYHDKEYLKKHLFQNEDDGIAVDLVNREQLSCGEKNRLDASPIYDGILLKPIYQNELLGGNLANSNYRLIKSLGNIPKHLQGKKLSPNLVIIKKGRKCAYATSNEILSERYDLMKVEPLIYVPEITLKTTGINKVHKVYFNFESNQTKATNKPKLPINQEIYSIEIKSYTSVDGNPEVNKKLYTNRANFIRQYLHKNLNIKTINTIVESKVNWELFDYQLELSGYDNLLKESNSTKKEVLLLNPVLWKVFLAEQRKSKAIIFQKGTWNEEDKQHNYYNLIDALLTNNNELANKALSEMYLQENSSFILDEDFMMEKLINNKELVQNTTALILKNIHNYKLDNIVFFVRNWLSKSEELSIEAQKNLLNLYTITTRELLIYWDSKKENLAKVLHPKKVSTLFDYYKSNDKVNPLFLNYHLAIIEYYGQINQSDKINESFTFITNYFRSKSLTIEDDILLALFFNKWSQYHLTEELLNKRYLDDDLNEKAFFMLLQTKVVSFKKNQDEIDYMHEQAIKLNKHKWCSWINRDFDLLRTKTVKKIYCESCN